MKELINAFILIILIVFAWIGYHRIFPDGISAARQNHSETKETSANQAINNPTEPNGNAAPDTLPTQAGISPGQAGDTGKEYTDFQLVSQISPDSMNQTRSVSEGAPPTVASDHTVEGQTKDRFDQAINLLERLDKLRGHQ